MESLRERRWCIDDDLDFFSRCDSSHIGVLVSLLEGGADTEQEDREDLTALHWAARLGQERVLVVLLEHYAFIEVRVMRMVDCDRIFRGDTFSRKLGYASLALTELKSLVLWNCVEDEEASEERVAAGIHGTVYPASESELRDLVEKEQGRLSLATRSVVLCSEEALCCRDVEAIGHSLFAFDRGYRSIRGPRRVVFPLAVSGMETRCRRHKTTTATRP